MKKKASKKENDLIEIKASAKQVTNYGNILNVVVELLESARRRRGYSARNLRQMRAFYLGWQIWQTVSAKSVSTDQSPRKILQTLSAESDQAKIEHAGSGKVDLSQLAARFPLPWSHYVLLLKVDNADARRFYETEALRGGWSVRQLN